MMSRCGRWLNPVMFCTALEGDGSMIIAVNYHYIRASFDAPYPSIFGVTPDAFIGQIDVLSRHGEFLGQEDIIEILDGDRPMPGLGWVITFDDGLREQYEIAWPILRQKGVPAIFYVNTKPVGECFITTTHKIHILRAYTSPEKVLAMLRDALAQEGMPFSLPSGDKAKSAYRYDTEQDAMLKYFLNHMLSEEQQGLIVGKIFHDLGFDDQGRRNPLYMDRDRVCELADAGCLGCHGHAHRPLGLLAEHEARSDVEQSMDQLQAWTGRVARSFSYPFGFKQACSVSVAEHARRKGARFAFTMERAGNRVIDAPMFMARFSSSDLFPSGKQQNLETFVSMVQHAKWFRENGVRSDVVA